MPLDLPAVAVAVSDPGHLHPGGRQQDHDGADGAAVAVPLDLPAVAVSDPEQLHPGDRHRHRAGTFPGAAVAVPLIFPEESGLLSLDAGLDLQEHDGKAQPWQRDGFSGSM